MNLSDLVQDWKRWSATADRPWDGWETLYPRWSDEVVPAITEALSEPIGNSDAEAILFFLGRDNECEHVLDMLSENPKYSERVAVEAIDHPDQEVRWQIAVVLGQIATGGTLDALIRMLADPDEYVRRRALLAVRDHRSQVAEETALSWLNSEHEYSRMVALDTLAEVKSRALLDAIQALEDDPSSVVQQRRATIIAETGQ